MGFPFDQPGFAEEFAEGLAARLLDDYVQHHLPTLHGALFILGILDAEEVFPTEEGRLAYTRRSIHWDRISKAIADPPGLFAEVYGWNSGAFRHRRFLDALELLLESASVIAHQVRPSENLHLLYYNAANHASRAIRSLEVPLFQVASPDFEVIVEAGLIVLPIPPKGDSSSAQPVGFAVTPMIRGTATPDMLDDESYVTMAVTGSFATDGAFRVDIRPDGVEATLDPAVTAIQGGIAILANPPEPWIALGDAEGSHLAFLAFSAGFELKGTVGDPEFIVSINAAAGWRQRRAQPRPRPDLREQRRVPAQSIRFRETPARARPRRAVVVETRPALQRPGGVRDPVAGAYRARPAHGQRVLHLGQGRRQTRPRSSSGSARGSA